MHFLVLEQRKGQDEPIDDLGGMLNSITDWLGRLRDLKKKGKVIHHWAFRAQHGSVTIFDVASGEELQKILSECPLDEQWVHREIHPVCDLEEEIDHLSKYMTGI